MIGQSTQSDASSDSAHDEFIVPHIESLRATPIESSYATVSIRGIPQNPTLRVEKVEDIIDNFETRSSDVFVATFVKAGTTWTQQIIHCLLRNGVEGGAYGNSVPWLEATTSDLLQSREAPGWTLEQINAAPLSQRRFFKTHATVRDLPRRQLDAASPPAKVICVARNPKDSLVSLYHHAKSKPEFNFTKGDFATFFRIFLSGQAENGDWFDHVIDWFKMCQANPSTHLFMRYEDMCDDHAGAVRKIAAFLDIPVTDELVDTVVKQSSISEMRSGGANIGLNHLRQGGYGNWRQLFSVQQNEFFDEVYRYRMRSAGVSSSLKFNFGDSFDGKRVEF